MTRQIIFKHFYDLPGNQCSVSSVQGSLVCPVSNIHTFFSCAPWGNTFCLRQQAKCKSFIKHYSQNCSALPLCHSPIISLSLSMWHSLFRWDFDSCDVNAWYPGRSRAPIQARSQREPKSGSGRAQEVAGHIVWHPTPTQLCICVYACACVWNGRRSIAFRWQFINFISSSLHLFLAHTHTHAHSPRIVLRLWKHSVSVRLFSLYLLPLSFDQLILVSA